jgi:toxin ParE1/3/4
MPRLRYLVSAQADFGNILDYIKEQSGTHTAGRKFARLLQIKCEKLASLPGTMGRSRPEIGSELRSSAFHGYVIFYRNADDVLEVVNILEGHRDAATHQEEDAGENPDV